MLKKKYNLLNIIKYINQRKYIYCLIRKKYLLFTNEEFVRQNVINYLLKKKYPIISFSLEKTILIDKTKRKIDIIVYSQGNPFILIECKSPYIQITQSIFDQINIYNSVLQSSYLMITNGITNFIFKIKNQKYIFVSSIPSYINNDYLL
jgi:hypothetical protein